MSVTSKIQAAVQEKLDAKRAAVTPKPAPAGNPRNKRPFVAIAKKYYLAPDVVALIEGEHQRTGYSRNIIIEQMVRQHFKTA